MEVRRLHRMLILLPADRMGGTERHTLEVAARLAARGMAVTLAAPDSLLPALEAAAPGFRGLRGAALGPDAQAATTRALLAEGAPDAVLLALPWPDAGLGAQAALAGSGIPRLVLLHLAPHEPPDLAALPLGATGTVFAAVSAPVARAAARAFGVPPHRVALLPNPPPAVPTPDRATARAAIRAQLGLPEDASLVLVLGRLEEAKGADLLPAISARLDATLAVAGDGLLEGLLRARAAEDPRGRLRILGPVADPAPWLAGADALLLPSRLEGAPLAFLEAVVHGCPVVATPAALAALGADAPRLAALAEGAPALAAAAADLLANPGQARAMAQAARQRLPRAAWAAPDWGRCIDDLAGLLRAACLMAEKEAKA
jgi:glycosyltransferase involved in cell wall biosynthesis